jgi:hypothetical protein
MKKTIFQVLVEPLEVLMILYDRAKGMNKRQIVKFDVQFFD